MKRAELEDVQRSVYVTAFRRFYLSPPQSQKPGPYVKEMNDAATFYTNRVLKDYKET